MLRSRREPAQAWSRRDSRESRRAACWYLSSRAMTSDSLLAGIAVRATCCVRESDCAGLSGIFHQR